MTAKELRIACVHQGYELYGSDRCFSESVAAIRAAYPAAQIEVVLPRHGPIVELLEGVATRIVFEPLWVLRRRHLAHLATIGLFRLPAAFARAFKRFRNQDLVYINTSVIADHIIVARFFPRRALLHVHEMPEGWTLKILSRLVRWSRAEIIFNSQATRTVFRLAKTIPSQVIYNGIRGPAAPEPMTYDGVRSLRLLMLGRISDAKGQDVLIDALTLFTRSQRQRIEVRIVGSAFEDPDRETALVARIEKLGLADTISVEPFQIDTAPLYRWADVVAVPSRRVEALGRVAIEAMAYGRPPIASDIGGLAEIVQHEFTGWLVPPSRANALAETLLQAIEQPTGWREFGAAGHARYLALFSEERAAAAIASVVRHKRESLECGE